MENGEDGSNKYKLTVRRCRQLIKEAKDTSDKPKVGRVKYDKGELLKYIWNKQKPIISVLDLILNK